MSTMSRVRTAISQSHDAIEQTDFAKSLLDGRVSRLSYACYLSQMHKVHATLEATVLRCPEIAAFFLAEMVRTPVLVRDLLELGYQAESFPEMPATQALTGQLANWSRTSPQALLGCIYI
ncbi:MAG: biliverdin-producing heme oxygenase [Pirellulaceae bacterium]|nr:biliverdin-producing heme oxygenase [Pirellulaceae bacterium]